MDATTSLLTDRYELTMLELSLANGTASRRSVFELFARSLPRGRSYGVVAGTYRALSAIENFRFGDPELSYLSSNGIVGSETLDFLADFKFSGDAWGFLEGELYFSGSPVLTIESTFAEALVLETVLLSIYNHDSAVASAVTRMIDAAGDRSILEGGARRTHEGAAVSAARAAYVAGVSATSNLEAGRTHRIPTVGTIGHAFIMSYPTEAEAFEAQLNVMGPDTTYLVDSYDIANGIRTAFEVVGPKLGAIRIDSGDLALETKLARHLLNELGARDTKIVASGDLNEWSILALSAAPIDSYLVGTAIPNGSGHPTAAMVYKLVATETASGEMVPVQKRSEGKATYGSRKAAFRVLDSAGNLERDVLIPAPHIPITDVNGPGRRLQVPLIRRGEVVGQPTLKATRNWCAHVRQELPDDARLPDTDRTFTSFVTD